MIIFLHPFNDSAQVFPSSPVVGEARLFAFQPLRFFGDRLVLARLRHDLLPRVTTGLFDRPPAQRASLS